MKIACVGAGPASLYFSILMRTYGDGHDVTVFERNPDGCSDGWGVTYNGSLLETLYAHDPVTAHAISENSVRWSDVALSIRGEKTLHQGDEGYSIGRQRLRDILTERTRSLGVDVQFERKIENLSQLVGADLVVAADGANSRLRQLHGAQFGTAATVGRNKYIWLGTSKIFNSFTFAFTETQFGWIWLYGYGFSGDRSTCIVECAPQTWAGLSMDRMSANDCLAPLEQIFQRELDGHPLINTASSNATAAWLSFTTVTNAKWYHNNVVLMGDAAHTTHFSVGAGTRLAVEDAIELAGALHRHEVTKQALDAYEKNRKLALLGPQGASRYSAQWYENIPRYIGLRAGQFVALQGQRQSPLLAHLPPLMYYRIHQAIEQIAVLRKLRDWAALRIMRTLQTRRSGKE
jgi:2-polyprenyl-6-methoxyphenol hydroxylase-like FAD-dependent oxidoreductase